MSSGLFSKGTLAEAFGFDVTRDVKSRQSGIVKPRQKSVNGVKPGREVEWRWEWR
jgi:hypothetical protein